MKKYFTSTLIIGVFMVAKISSGGHVYNSNPDSVHNDSNYKYEFYGDKSFFNCKYEYLKGVGDFNLTGSKINTLESLGDVTLNTTNVGEACLAGQLKTNSSTINRELNLRGKFEKNSYGQLEAYRSTFNGPINHYSKFTSLDQSTCNRGITFKSYSANDNINETLTLGQSTINGDVVFESGRGRVVMDNRSKINGRLIGGKYTS